MAGFRNKERALRRLRRLGPAVRKAVRAAIAAEAAELAAAMERRAPRDDGELQGSIVTEPLRGAAIGTRVKAGGPATTKPVRKSEKGAAPNYDYALAQEFGTAKMRANPFFYPTYRLSRRRIRRNIAAAAKKAINDAAGSP